MVATVTSLSQILFVPFIALIGAWIAARQMLIAEEKLKFDIFDRRYEKRFAVYEATRSILASPFDRSTTDDRIKAYGFYTLDAKFLFDDEMFKYLRDVQHHVATWYDCFSRANKMLAGEERDQVEALERNSLKWIIEQGDNQSGLTVKFKPFLVHSPLPRPWLLRWP
jgi:hypothetical protein